MNHSPQRDPRYSAYSSQTRRRKRRSGPSPLAITLIILVCVCFLVLSFLLLRNKDQRENNPASSSSGNQVHSSSSISPSSVPPVSGPVSSGPGRSDPPASSTSAPVQSRPDLQGEPVAFSFFDDAIFIGDSITNQMSQYTARMRNTSSGFMGKARFGGVGSYSVFNALQPVTATDGKGNLLPHHLLNGVRMQTHDFIYARNQERPVNKAFIMFGTNDLNMYKDIPTYLAAYKQYLDRITTKNPQLTIYLMSTTPVTKTYATTHKGRLNPKGIDDYNKQLKAFCAQNGYRYIDVNTAVRDAEGYLPADWASGDGFHPNDKGYAAIIESLRRQVGA